MVAIAQSRSFPHGVVIRARIVLLAADGVANAAIAEKLGFSQQSVCLWRKRYLEQGIKGLHDELDVHVVVDNSATHKHPTVKRWLAAHERWHVHYTPTYASWLNQVEIWFNTITQKAIRRGTFKSVKELVAKIQQYIDRYNRHPHPFTWTATADSILAKIERLSQLICGTLH